MAISVNIASDITAIQLEGYLRPSNPKDILQHVQNKPLLRILQGDSKLEFGSAGPAASTTTPPNLREGVMGALMKDQAGFYVGIAGADTLAFTASDGAVQTTAPVRWMHAGFKITHDELLNFGVHVTKDNNTSSTAEERNTLLDGLATRKADYLESTMYARNQTLWLTGAQDSKAIAGIKSILTDDPTAGTTMGISRANLWWRHLARTGVGGALPKYSYSKSDQTLTETLISDWRQLMRFGGNPDVWLAGSDFIDAAEREARAKGTLTMTGWADSKTNLQVKGVKIGNLEIEYDPTLDDLGEAKRCYAWDSRHLRLRPQKGEWGKVTNQNQPYDQFVMLISTTDRGTLACNQMDCNLVGELA